MSRSKSSESARADRARRVYRYEHMRRDIILRESAPVYVLPACWRPEVWVKLVRFCRKRSIDPAAYIQWALGVRPCWFSSILEPNQLLQPMWMDAFTADQPRIRNFVRQLLVRNLNTARVHIGYLQSDDMPSKDSWASTLVNDSLGLTPLFRFALARDIGGERFEKIAKLFEDRALFQYQIEADYYDQEWGERWVQPWFRAVSAKLYDEAIHQEFSNGAEVVLV